MKQLLLLFVLPLLLKDLRVKCVVVLGCEMLPTAEAILLPASVKLLGEAKCKEGKGIFYLFLRFALMNEILVSNTCSKLPDIATELVCVIWRQALGKPLILSNNIPQVIFSLLPGMIQRLKHLLFHPYWVFFMVLIAGCEHVLAWHTLFCCCSGGMHWKCK